MKLRNALVVSALVYILGGCASTGDRFSSRPEAPTAPERSAAADVARCVSCGVVERIDVRRQGGDGTIGAGAVSGALVGTAGTTGSKAAAGDPVDPERARQVFAVTVRLDDGRTVVIEQRALQGVREGARVQVRGDSVQLM